MSKIDANLQSLCDLAKKFGATNAISFSAKDVAVDERVRLKCRVPVCDDYGANLMCPPNGMSVQEFRDALARYKHAILVQFERPLPPDMRPEIAEADDVSALYKSQGFMDSYRKNFDPVKLKLHETVSKVEAQAFMMGYRFAVGFIAGSCRLCPRCAALDQQRQCRHAFRARPSMEAVGIDAYQTAKNAGLPFDIPLKDKTVWNGLILIA